MGNWDCLLVLYRDGRASIRDVSNKLGVSYQSVWNSLVRYENSGFVYSRMGISSRMYELTNKGSTHVKECLECASGFNKS